MVMKLMPWAWRHGRGLSYWCWIASEGTEDVNLLVLYDDVVSDSMVPKEEGWLGSVAV